MRPRSESLVIEPDIPVIHAMERMASEGWDRLIVMQGEEIVGLVTHSAIVHFLQLRNSSSQ
jgi:CBS domain-containing protein